MAKTYTPTRPKAAGDFALETDFNKPVSGWMQEFNGQLDGQQLPMESITDAKILKGTNMDAAFDTKPDGTRKIGKGQRNATQSYWYVTSAISAFTWDRNSSGAYSLGPPAVEYENDDNQWLVGIMPLYNDIADGVFMRIPTSEGMLTGGATVDIEFGSANQRTAGGGNASFGFEWRYQVYVYVDGVCVATTGLQPAMKRRSHTLPFAVPVPTKDAVEIDIRISAICNGAGVLNPFAGNHTTNAQLNITNTQIWARNAYR
tara:strand:+ start:1590 stop:2366 length:777 start_codon:yes stop_codon:yes gene_type:complete